MEERSDNSNESPSSPKRARNCSDENERVDRISGLPDFVLLQILSLLDMKDAVKAGVLSKRWERLWASVPDLFFWESSPDDDSDDHEDEFVNLVDRTLILYEGSKIRKFGVLCYEYRAWFASYVDSWIRFVVRKKVENLDLDLWPSEYGDHYELPRHLYSNASLTKLRLSYCHFRPPLSGLFSWRLLTSLSLNHIPLSDNLIQDILSGSPSLQVLDLSECSGFMHLNITSPCLKKLMVNYDDYDSTTSDSVLEISAPYLQSLALIGLWYRKCRLMNLPCLVQAKLLIEVVPDNGDRDNGYEWRYNFLRELLENLHHVRDLKIGTWCIQILSTWELKILPSPSSKRKCLILDTCLDKLDLPGIASLLKSSPDLETLLVSKTIPPFYSVYLHDFDGENYWESSEPFSQCLLHNLKTVKIFDFIGGDHEMDLVQFILKHAMTLEKMVIYSKRLAHLNWRKHFMPEELLEFTEEILSFPRASPHAVILLS
ncbi:hypothetical protein HHK36_023719 [Tetracentron sinense]|uniref:F-box domain-containing protein n=1 Tax=Tetracentron sinense TaxID=13715 RepID=A0A835D8Y1_TETSI|nr:hypothetical protein HHK36_023719 [Tetracentron sinense]